MCKKTNASFWLGAPWHQADKENFETALLTRYKDQIEKPFLYVNAIIDRQISKAGGLLAYNSILYAATTISATATLSESICGFLALASSFPLIMMMHVIWGSSTQYETSQAEFKATCKMIYRRSYALTASLILSLIATVFAIWDLWARVAPYFS